MIEIIRGATGERRSFETPDEAMRFIMRRGDHNELWREVTPDDCAYCAEHGDGMMPPHTASARCESGGRNHCTCDICF